MAAKKTERAYADSNEIASLEHSWWNENSGTIVRVWEMHDNISRTVRKGYLKRARRFLLGDKKTALVLELGCGSGWVGQMLAGPDVRILGSDFSESQIRRAQENAKKKGLQDHCKYLVAGCGEWAAQDQADARTSNGVLIHCFLHHLNKKELLDLLADLRAQLADGARIWIYEPAFYVQATTTPAKIKRTTRWLCRAASSLIGCLDRLSSCLGLIDKEVQEDFQKLANQAEENGWYLSPKEIPFDVDEFNSQLKTCFDVKIHYWATLSLVGWVFNTNILKSRALRWFLNVTVLPFLAFADRLACDDESYARRILVAPNYAFHAWECVLSKNSEAS